MGTWGIEAYENDTAADWLFKHFVPQLKRTIASKRADPQEQLAALAIAYDLDLAFWLDPPVVDAAFARIELADEAAGWDNLAARLRYVHTLQRRIHAACKTPTRSWSPVGAILSEKSSAKPRRTSKARAPAKAVKKTPAKKASKS